jgi:ATP-dependent Clp protease ATP-binding subunit ClpC
VFERFTERARNVLVCAQDEARELRHNYIGTEHLLLGLLREGDGFAARALVELGVTLEEAQGAVRRIVGQGDEVTTGQIPFTPRARKVLELSLREARALDHDYIDTEHVLLGIVCENEGVAARILLDFDADPGRVRAELEHLLGKPTGRFPRSSRHEMVAVPGQVGRSRPSLVPASMLVVGWLLFALALGVGILVGWAIWGH